MRPGPDRSTIGAPDPVRLGARSAAVPDALVEALPPPEHENGPHTPRTRTFREDEPVRVVGRALAGYRATLHVHTGRERVVILRRIADRAAAIQVDAEHIEPLHTDRLRGLQEGSEHG